MILANILICASLKAVDGDTVKCNGKNLRILGPGAPFVSGVDTPELHRPKCAAEKMLAELAKKRVERLLTTKGLKIKDSGEKDRTSSQRPLVWLILPNGETVGSLLLKEGYALPWRPGKHNNWCKKLERAQFKREPVKHPNMRKNKT